MISNVEPSGLNVNACAGPIKSCFGELCGIAADLNGDALDSGCHVDDHLLLGIRKAHLHRADRLKMVIKIPRQISPTGFTVNL